MDIYRDIKMIIAQIIIILLGFVAINIYNPGSNEKIELGICELAVESQKKSINDLELQNGEFYKENKELKQKIEIQNKSIKNIKLRIHEFYEKKKNLKKKIDGQEGLRNDNRPILNDMFKQKIMDKYENSHYGRIDLKHWPEFHGQTLSLNNTIYPIENIQSICFWIDDGSGFMNITTIDKINYKHKVADNFFRERVVELRGKIIRKFRVDEINCLLFSNVIE